MLQPPPEQQMQLGFSPLPTQLLIDSIDLNGPEGVKRFLTFTFNTPQGVNCFFVDGNAAEQVCSMIRAKASGLQIATSLR